MEKKKEKRKKKEKVCTNPKPYLSFFLEHSIRMFCGVFVRFIVGW